MPVIWVKLASLSRPPHAKAAGVRSCPVPGRCRNQAGSSHPRHAKPYLITQHHHTLSSAMAKARRTMAGQRRRSRCENHRSGRHMIGWSMHGGESARARVQILSVRAALQCTHMQYNCTVVSAYCGLHLLFFIFLPRFFS